MRKPIIQNEIFYCHHLCDDDQKDVQNFTVSNAGYGLQVYLTRSAYPDEDSGVMRTYLIRDNDTDELVAYFSLKAGHVSTNEYEYEEDGKMKTAFENIPGVEIANFAVNEKYVRYNPLRRGSGLVVFRDFIMPIIKMASEMIGIKIIFIFALPEENLIKTYAEKYKFRRLSKEAEDKLHARNKPSYDESCIFMFQLI